MIIHPSRKWIYDTTSSLDTDIAKWLNQVHTYITNKISPPLLHSTLSTCTKLELNRVEESSLACNISLRYMHRFQQTAFTGDQLTSAAMHLFGMKSVPDTPSSNGVLMYTCTCHCHRRKSFMTGWRK